MINSYVALDLETTGLNPKMDRILEIGAIKVKEGKIIDSYQTFVDAGVVISERIKELTGIQDYMIAAGKKPEAAMNELVEFCEDYILLGHNIQFDFSFIKRWTVNHKLTFDKNGIDTLKISKKLLSHLEKRSLEYLCKYYHIEHNNKHRAYDDAKAASDLYQLLAEEYSCENEELFHPYPLIYQAKKEVPITIKQKSYLNDLLKYHKIEIDYEIDSLTKNEASRIIDKIILNKGRRLSPFQGFL